ncbi:MAG: hypothetical protein WCB51_14980 [Candidatus Dormiibacterota bacterium]
MLESETNGSLAIGVTGSDCAPLIVTAVGSSVVLAVGVIGAVLTPISSLCGRCAPGPRLLAEGCDRALRGVHRLPADFTPTLCFADPLNARRFRERDG